MTNNLNDITKAFELAEKTAILRDAFNQLMKIEGVKPLYGTYSILRSRGFNHEYLISLMGNLSPETRKNIDWVFEKFYKAQFKVRGR